MREPFLRKNPDRFCVGGAGRKRGVGKMNSRPALASQLLRGATQKQENRRQFLKNSKTDFPLYLPCIVHKREDTHQDNYFLVYRQRKPGSPEYLE